MMDFDKISQNAKDIESRKKQLDYDIKIGEIMSKIINKEEDIIKEFLNKQMLDEIIDIGKVPNSVYKSLELYFDSNMKKIAENRLLVSEFEAELGKNDRTKILKRNNVRARKKIY